MFHSDIHGMAQKIITGYTAVKKKIVTAESCTGGLVAAALTAIPGSSEVFERGFIAYSNAAKIEVLGVLPDLLDARGAVSGEVAEAMAAGALEFSLADVAVSVTGVAGPGGGTLAKPAGTVFAGLATRAGVAFHVQCHFKGGRDDVRLQSVREALALLTAHIGDIKLE